MSMWNVSSITISNENSWFNEQLSKIIPTLGVSNIPIQHAHRLRHHVLGLCHPTLSICNRLQLLMNGLPPIHRPQLHPTCPQISRKRPAVPDKVGIASALAAKVELLADLIERWDLLLSNKLEYTLDAMQRWLSRVHTATSCVLQLLYVLLCIVWSAHRSDWTA